MQDDDQDLNRHLQMRRKPIRLRTNRTDSCLFLVGLTVVAFILAAILVPIFQAAQPKAHAATCLSNVKQLSMAMLLYTQDWDEHLPSAARWGDSIFKYLAHDRDATSLFHCPDAASPYSYAFNRRLGNLVCQQIAEPSETVVIFEADVSNINASGGISLVPLMPRHTGRSTFGFADGHVKWVRQPADQLRWKP